MRSDELRRGAQGLGADDAARGVVRRVEDDELRARSQPGGELVDVEGEVRGLVQRQGHRRGARPADRGLVDREARVGVHDLVTGSAGGEDGEEQERLGAGAHEDALGVDRDAARARQLGRRRLAQLGQPRARAVVRLARAERRAARLDDVRRGGEVGLADLEVEDVAPRALQRACPGQHGERGLGPEPMDPARQRRPRRRAHPPASVQQLVGGQGEELGEVVAERDPLEHARASRPGRPFCPDLLADLGADARQSPRRGARARARA